MAKMIIIIVGLVLIIGIAYIFFILTRKNSNEKPKRTNDIDFLTVTQSLKKNVEAWVAEVKTMPISKQITTLEDKRVPVSPQLLALCIEIGSIDPEPKPIEIAKLVCDDLGYNTTELSNAHVKFFTHLDMKIVIVFIVAYSEEYILKQVRELDLFNKIYSSLAVLYPKPKSLGKPGISYDIIFNRIKGASTTRDIRPRR